jgi:hypothetical protein
MFCYGRFHSVEQPIIQNGEIRGPRREFIPEIWHQILPSAKNLPSKNFSQKSSCHSEKKQVCSLKRPAGFVILRKEFYDKGI